MNERDFCYWLKGYLELTYQQHLTSEQVSVIKEHLDLVFDKKTKLSVNQNEFRIVPADHLEEKSIPHLTC
jgi:hypothetical protein